MQRSVSTEPLARADGSQEAEEAGRNDGEDRAEPNLSDLASLLRNHSSTQDAWEARHLQEVAEQDRRFDALKQQSGLLRQSVDGQQHTSQPLGGALGGTSHKHNSRESDEEVEQLRPTSRDPCTGRHRCSEPRLEKLSDSELEAEQKVKPNLKTINVQLNGKQFQALIDSGSDQTLVHQGCIPYDAVQSADPIVIRCVHSDKKLLSTVDVYLEVQGQMYLLTVGTAENLPFSVVLGRDLAILPELLQLKRCSVAVTRSQKKQGEEPSLWVSAFPFYDADLEDAPGKSRKPCREKRQDKFRYIVNKISPESPSQPSLGFKLPLNLVEMQQTGSSLTGHHQKAKEPEETSEEDLGTGERYFLQTDVLYRRCGPSRQLMLPHSVRETVLTLGHSIPWAGLLGKHNSVARIKRQFFGPGMGDEVAEFCRSGPQCQHTSPKGPPRALLQPLPVVSVPFKRLGMDVVRPVEKSRAGNRFVLVSTDYATKYSVVPCEVCYSTVKKDALAIKWALDSYKYYLLGREFVWEDGPSLTPMADADEGHQWADHQILHCRLLHFCPHPGRPMPLLTSSCLAPVAKFQKGGSM